jgi:hypothetical protein
MVDRESVMEAAERMEARDVVEPWSAARGRHG